MVPETDAQHFYSVMGDGWTYFCPGLPLIPNLEKQWKKYTILAIFT